MVLKLFCARRTRKNQNQKKKALELFFTRRIRKALTNPKRHSSVFSPIIIICPEWELQPVLFCICSALWMWLWDRSQFPTMLPIEANPFSRSTFCRIICWQCVLFIDLNSVRGKCGFWKKVTRLPWWQWIPQWRTGGLEMAKPPELFLGKVGPIKYQI